MSSSTATAPSNIHEVKQKALGLLTELYKTETGDVKKMAMSLLQTLYTVEDEEQIAEMEIKIQKLLTMIQEQKREETFEIEAPEEDSSSPDATTTTTTRGGTRGTSNIATTDEDSSVTEMKEFSERDEDDTNTGKEQEAFVKEAMAKQRDQDSARKWKWPNLEGMENLRKSDFAQSKEKIIKGWRESTSKIENKIESIDFRTPRERIINGWRESTSKFQILTARRNHNNNKDDDSSSEASATTDASSNPASPVGSETATYKESTSFPAAAADDEDLLNVIRNFVKEGDPNSRASLEQALSTKRQNAKNKWTEARSKWKWPMRAPTPQTS